MAKENENADKSAKTAQSRINDQENALIRDTLKGRDDLLILLRNSLFGFKLEDAEKDTLKKVFGTDSWKKLLRKIFLPEIEKDNPIWDYISQPLDLWLTIDLQNKDQSMEMEEIISREILLDMLENGLKSVETLDNSSIDLFSWKNVSWEDNKIANLKGRNRYIVHVNQQIVNLRVLSEMKSETPEETKNRLMKNSTK